MKKMIAVLILLALIPLAVLGYVYTNKETLLADKLKAHLKELTGTDIVLENVLLEKLQNSSDWTLKIEKMLIQNPESYPSPHMAVLNKVQMIFEPFPVLLGQWKVRKISAILRKVYFQNNEKGDFNMAQMPAIQAVSAATAAAKKKFWVDSFEIQYGKLYRGEEVHKLHQKREVYNHIDDPGVLIQAPVLSLVNTLNQGSLGLPRGKLQESVSRHVDVKI